VDGAPAMVQLARRRVPEAADRLVEGRIERLPFDAGRFDAVVSAGVFAYVDDRQAMLAEMARVLKPGGRAVLSTGNAWSLTYAWRHELLYPVIRRVKAVRPFGRPAPLPRARLPGRRRLVAMMRAAGLDVDAVEFASFAVLPDPVSHAFPELGRRLARSAPRAPRRLHLLLAGQIVVRATKRVPAANSAAGRAGGSIRRRGRSRARKPA
jgi:SAM-dependent methyltransferase